MTFVRGDSDNSVEHGKELRMKFSDPSGSMDLDLFFAWWGSWSFFRPH
jgi:hypothetical protein